MNKKDQIIFSLLRCNGVGVKVWSRMAWCGVYVWAKVLHPCKFNIFKSSSHQFDQHDRIYLFIFSSNIRNKAHKTFSPNYII